MYRYYTYKHVIFKRLYALRVFVLVVFFNGLKRIKNDVTIR